VACYFFVRPKRKYLEVCFFLGRTLRAPQVRRAMASSKTKVAHLIQVRHRDEVESPITDWLQEAYDFSEIDARRFSGIAARTRETAASGPAPVRATAGKPQRKRAPAKKKKAARKTAKKR
jgi:hypothetical protein